MYDVCLLKVLARQVGSRMAALHEQRLLTRVLIGWKAYTLKARYGREAYASSTGGCCVELAVYELVYTWMKLR